MKCKECDRTLRQISYRHLQSCCGLTPIQYKEKHDVTSLQDDDVKQKSARYGSDNGRWVDGTRTLPQYCECGRKRDHRAKKCSVCVDRSGPNNPFYGKKHTVSTLEKIFEKRTETDIEILVATELEKANIPFTKQFFITHEGNTYAYDFKITGHPVLIEVDGDYWHGGPGCSEHFRLVESVKHTDQIKNGVAKLRDYRVVRVWGSEVKSNPKLILERLSLND